MFYRNGWTNRAGFGLGAPSIDPSMLQGCLGISKRRVLSETLSQTPDLENFATAYRSCCRQNSSMAELVDDTDGGRCVVAGRTFLSFYFVFVLFHFIYYVYFASVDRNALTPSLCFVVDLLHNLFLQLCSSWQDFDWLFFFLCFQCFDAVGWTAGRAPGL